MLPIPPFKKGSRDTAWDNRRLRPIVERVNMLWRLRGINGIEVHHSDGRILIGPPQEEPIIDGSAANPMPSGTPPPASPPFSVNGPVYSIFPTSDGTLIGGAFTSVASTSRNRIARVTSNGWPLYLDTTFDPGTGFNSTVNAVMRTSGNSIVAGGTFDTFNGTSIATGVAKINPDGSRDTGFNAGSGYGGSSAGLGVRHLIESSGGQYLVCGDFTTWNGTTSIQQLVRLNTNGARDTGFTAANLSDPPEDFDNAHRKIAKQSDGKIICVRLLIHRQPSSVLIGYGRLNANGSFDSSFTLTPFPGGAFGDINCLAMNGDDFYIGVAWASLGGTPLGKVSSAGVFDSSWTNDITGGELWDMVVSGGKIYVAGQFQLDGHGSTNYGAACLNSDGSLAFIIGGAISGGTGSNTATAFAINLQADGKILVGGNFTSMGGHYAYLSRFNSDGTADA